MPTPEGSIASIVLGPVRPRPPGVLVGAVLATLVIHGAAGLFAWRAGSTPKPAALPVAPTPSIRVEHVVELTPSVPVPPPPEPPAPRLARSPMKAPAAAPRAPTPPEPAQAAAVVAVEPAEAPLDFTGFDLVSGASERYAGGVTSASGRSATAVPATAAPEPAPLGRARAVRLPARSWSCPWPREADALRIDEQTVVLRVVVTPEGRVTSAELLADPGYGFGQAALDCARGARFDAALDAEGRPQLATSPPIRVRFTRGG